MRPQILILKRSYIKKAVTAVRSYLSIRIGKPEVTAGVLREDALQVLRAYFEKEQK